MAVPAVKIPAPITFRSPDSDSRFRVPNSKYNDNIARAICEELMMGKSLAETNSNLS